MSQLAVQHAAILAGGQSSRMGQEKALLPFQGQRLIAHITSVLKPLFPQVIVVTSKPEVAEAAGLPAISDRYPHSGPLGGIHTALAHFQAPTFVIACDMPFLSGDFISYLAARFEGKTLLPYSDSGSEPLHAIYSPENIPIFEQVLLSGEKTPSLRRILNRIEHQIIPVEVARGYDATLQMFDNWNTPHDIKPPASDKL